MIHLVGIGGREFSVGRLAGCRSPFTESTLTTLGLSQPDFKRCLATALRVSSSTTTKRYVLHKDVDPKLLGSENNAMKETQQSHFMTPLVLLQQQLQ